MEWESALGQRASCRSPIGPLPAVATHSWGQFSAPIPGAGYDKRWKNPAAPLGDSLPQNVLARGLGPSIWSPASSFHSGPGGNYEYTAFLRGKQLPYPGHFQELETRGWRLRESPVGWDFPPGGWLLLVRGRPPPTPPVSWGPALRGGLDLHGLSPLTPFDLCFCTSFPFGGPSLPIQKSPTRGALIDARPLAGSGRCVPPAHPLASFGSRPRAACSAHGDIRGGVGRVYRRGSWTGSRSQRAPRSSCAPGRASSGSWGQHPVKLLGHRALGSWLSPASSSPNAIVLLSPICR